MTDYSEKIKFLLPDGYAALLGASQPRPTEQRDMTEEEWQSVVDNHNAYIDDFRGKDYSEFTPRQKELVRSAVDGFAKNG